MQIHLPHLLVVLRDFPYDGEHELVDATVAGTMIGNFPTNRKFGDLRSE